MSNITSGVLLRSRS